jgi:hypothetical protein
MLRLAKDMQEFMYVLGVLPTNLFIVHFVRHSKRFSLGRVTNQLGLNLTCNVAT